MSDQKQKRGWWQFSLRGVFFLMLVVSAYLAGRMHQSSRSRELDDQLESELRFQAFFKNYEPSEAWIRDFDERDRRLREAYREMTAELGND